MKYFILQEMNKGFRFDFRSQVKSSTELLAMYKKVKQEKITHAKESAPMQDKNFQLASVAKAQVDGHVKRQEQRRQLKTKAATQEKDCNSKKKKIPMPITVSHSQGSTSRQDHDKAPKSTNLTQKKTTTQVEISSQKQDLKRKFTITTAANSEGCSDMHQVPIEKTKKIRKFSATSIDDFLKTNKKHYEGEVQVDENEGDNDLEEQDEGDVNPSEGQEKTDAAEGNYFISSYPIGLWFFFFFPCEI